LQVINLAAVGLKNQMINIFIVLKNFKYGPQIWRNDFWVYDASRHCSTLNKYMLNDEREIIDEA
jgi:hypothetical protein